MPDPTLDGLLDKLQAEYAAHQSFCTQESFEALVNARQAVHQHFQDAVQAERGLFQWLEVNAVSLHCNFIGGHEAWSATYHDLHAGTDIPGLGDTPSAAIQACKNAVTASSSNTQGA